MSALLRELHAEESGQDLIEYAFIGLVIALGTLAAMSNLGKLPRQ